MYALDSSELLKIKNKVIFIDLDDTIYPTLLHLNLYYNKFTNLNLEVEDYTDYSLMNMWNMDKKQVRHILKGFFRSNFFKSMKPHDYAKQVCEKLAVNNTLYVLTSRHFEDEQLTKDKLKFDFEKNTFKEIFVTGESMIDGIKQTKDLIVAKHNGDYIFEDYPPYIDATLKITNAKSILFPMPFNKYVKETDNIKIAKSLWESVPNILLAYEGLVKQN